MKRWILAAAGVAFALGMQGRAEYPTLKARPKPLDGIPGYPYQPSSTAPKGTATGTGQSRIGLGNPGEAPTVIESPGIGTTTTRETTTCTVSATCRKTVRTETRDRVTTTGPASAVMPVPTEAATFALKERSLRVDHCSVSGVSVTLYPDGKYTVSFKAEMGAALALKRNLFLLTVRGYANDPLGETKGSATKAAVIQIPMEPFWVNRSEPYTGFIEGSSDAVKRNYKWIDRVDMDFTYR